MKRFLTFIPALLFLVTTVLPCSAGSVLSSRGPGMPYLMPDGRAAGMGFLSIAQDNPFSLSRINPAGMHRIQTSMLSLHYFYEHNRYKDPGGNATSQYGNFDGFTFAVPLGSGIGFAGGLSPWTRTDYRLSFQRENEGELYTRSVEGSGGINSAELSLFLDYGTWIGFGITGRYLFGNTAETWTVDYSGASFTDSQDEFDTQHWGYGLTLGMVVRPFRSLLLGGVYTPETDLNNRTTVSYSYKNNVFQNQFESRFPASYGMGMTWTVAGKAIIGIEYQRRDWSNLTIQPNETGFYRFRDTNRYAFGVEYLNSRDPMLPYFRRIAWRAGFMMQPYYYTDPDGNDLDEKWITLGMGFPLIRNQSMVDIAVMVGQRGSLSSNGLQENLFRLSVSVTGGEKWFIRRY